MTIEELIQRNKELSHQCSTLKYKLRKKNEGMSDFKKKYKAYGRKRYLEFLRKVTGRFNKRVNDHVAHTKEVLMIKAVSRAGLLTFTTLQRYCMQTKININEMAYLVVLELVESLDAKDCYRFGLDKYKTARHNLIKLSEIGLAEKIDRKYVISLLGKRVVTEFSDYHKEVTKNIIDSAKYKRDTKPVKRPYLRVKNDPLYNYGGVEALEEWKKRRSKAAE